MPVVLGWCFIYLPTSHSRFQELGCHSEWVSHSHHRRLYSCCLSSPHGLDPAHEPTTTSVLSSTPVHIYESGLEERTAKGVESWVQRLVGCLWGVTREIECCRGLQRRLKGKIKEGEGYFNRHLRCRGPGLKSQEEGLEMMRAYYGEAVFRR